MCKMSSVNSKGFNTKFGFGFFTGFLLQIFDEIFMGGFDQVKDFLFEICFSGVKVGFWFD